MSTKHTPGPWKQDGTRVLLQGGTREFQPRYTMVLQDQDVADARLIAAAPELLALVKSVLAEQIAHGVHGDAELISRCEQLVAKAEGSEK